MEIIYKSTKEIKPYENNPRNNNEAVEKVAVSITDYGFRVPIIIDSNNVIVAGHTRYKAALKIGCESVPCIVIDDLTPEQIRAYRLVDNKTAEYSSWDFEMLEKEFIKNKNNENTGRIKVTKKYIPPDVTALRTILQLKQAGKW